MTPPFGGDCCAAGLLQTMSFVLPVSGYGKWWYLYRRGSVFYAGSVSSQGMSRPPSNRHPRVLVAQTDPGPRGCPLNPIFMLGGAPKAHEVFYSSGGCAPDPADITAEV